MISNLLMGTMVISDKSLVAMVISCRLPSTGVVSYRPLGRVGITERSLGTVVISDMLFGNIGSQHSTFFQTDRKSLLKKLEQIKLLSLQHRFSAPDLN